MIYNFVSKTLTNRFKKNLPKIMRDPQNAFLHGKLIIDNVVVASKMMHHCGHKGGSRHLVMWSKNHKYSILSRNDLLILPSEYGFGV